MNYFLIFFSEEPAPIPTSTASPTVKVASPVSEQPSSKTVDTSHNPTSPTANKQLDNRKTGKGQCLSLVCFYHMCFLSCCPPLKKK